MPLPSAEFAGPFGHVQGAYRLFLPPSPMLAGTSPAEVLAPVGAAFFVADPHAILAIDRQARAGLEGRRGRHRDHRLALPVAEPPQEDVVVAAGIAVPGHVDLAAGVGGNGRVPMIGRLVGHGDRLGAGGRAEQEDLKILAAAALPGPPYAALRVGGRDDVDVGPRLVRELLDGRPGAGRRDRTPGDKCPSCRRCSGSRRPTPCRSRPPPRRASTSRADWRSRPAGPTIAGRRSAPGGSGRRCRG